MAEIVDDAPIHHPGGSGATTTHPIKKGDEGIVVYAAAAHKSTATQTVATNSSNAAYQAIIDLQKAKYPFTVCVDGHWYDSAMVSSVEIVTSEGRIDSICVDLTKVIS